MIISTCYQDVCHFIASVSKAYTYTYMQYSVVVLPLCVHTCNSYNTGRRDVLDLLTEPEGA